MAQILRLLEILFTQDSKVEDLFCGAQSCSEPSLFFSNYLFGSGLKFIQDDFQHDFARIPDEVDSSVVLAVLFCGCWRYFSHRILRLKIYSVVLNPALNPACSSAIISSAPG